MGYLSKVLIGAVVGVGAVAAAPFTGGGSLLAGATLASSLTGAGLLATGAGLVGAGVGAVTQGVQDEFKEDDIKEAKKSSFEDGVNEGKAATAKEVKKYVDFYLATTALSYYIARCDGFISKEEQLEIDFDLDAIKKNMDIPDAVINEMKQIINNTNITFDNVKIYLDKVNIKTLLLLEQDIDEIIDADNEVTEEELQAKKMFTTYLKGRQQNE